MPPGQTDGRTVRARRAQRCCLVGTRSAGSHALLATGRLPPLTSVDSVALGDLRAGGRRGGWWEGVLCRSRALSEHAVRQVLHTVPQCALRAGKKKKRRETAGAGHQHSLQMTSPDKCWSDSHPHPPTQCTLTHTHTLLCLSSWTSDQRSIIRTGRPDLKYCGTPSFPEWPF